MSIGAGLGMNLEQPDDEEIQELEIDNYSDGEETIDDGVGEMQILLYHFLSI